MPFERPGADGSLASLSVEAQLLTPPADGVPIEADAPALGRELAKRLFGEMATDNEIIMYTFKGTPLVLRVTGSSFPEEDGEAEEEAAAATEVADVTDGDGDDPSGGTSGTKHCFRGLVDARTRVYVGQSTVFCSSSSQRAVCEGLKLLDVQAAPERPPKNCVHVHTSDGEVFPVHRSLLRSCIALTKAVRDTASTPPEVHVSVDCCTFDRVLLFLEASAKRGSGGAAAAAASDPSAADAFAFDMHSLPDLSLAAQALGCRQLRESCERRLGAFKERIGMHRWHEVVETNQRGGCMVTMDGMVFDLLAWLPEHPGGSTIIPEQALNVDCTVFFELYHASRESFTYLREFYVGELHTEEREVRVIACGLHPTRRQPTNPPPALPATPDPRAPLALPDPPATPNVNRLCPRTPPLIHGTSQSLPPPLVPPPCAHSARAGGERAGEAF